jgi:hypothetical protein
MDRTPPTTSLAVALTLRRTPGRSTEVFRVGDLEISFAAKPTNGPQVPHQRDEFYGVAAGTAHYWVPDRARFLWRFHDLSLWFKILMGLVCIRGPANGRCDG